MFKTDTSIFIAGSFFALTGVMLGAFGAHALGDGLDPSQKSAFETGVRYQFYHAFALFIIPMLFGPNVQKRLRLAAFLFTIGIVLFSGSLYLLAAKDAIGIESWAWLGPLTPIGGLFLISGWAIVLWAQIKR